MHLNSRIPFFYVVIVVIVLNSFIFDFIFFLNNFHLKFKKKKIEINDPVDKSTSTYGMEWLLLFLLSRKTLLLFDCEMYVNRCQKQDSTLVIFGHKPLAIAVAMAYGHGVERQKKIVL